MSDLSKFNNEIIRNFNLANNITNEISDKDPAINIDNRTIILPSITLAVSQDNNSQIITFKMPKYIEGVDVSTKTIQIKVKNSLGETAKIDVVNVKTDDVAETLEFGWLIDSRVTKNDGVVEFAVKATGYIEEDLPYYWNTKPSKLIVEKGLVVEGDIAPLTYISEKYFYANNSNLKTYNELEDSHSPIQIVGRDINFIQNYDIAVTQDNHSQMKTFEIDRYISGVDISNMLIDIVFVNADGKSDRVAAVNKIVNASRVIFAWVFDSRVTYKSGNVQFAIEIIGYDEFNDFFKWSTKSKQLRIDQGLNVDGNIYVEQASWIQQIELDIDDLYKTKADGLSYDGDELQLTADGKKIGTPIIITGGVGGTGYNGWSPITGIATDGNREVLQVVDWAGGTGTKPEAGRYVGSSGLTTNIAEAVNIKGSDGSMGANGADGTTPHIGNNGNWWIGASDTGYPVDKYIVTTLSADDPEFPVEVGKFTLSLAGQPANTGPQGAPGVPGADAWTAEYAIVPDNNRRVMQVSNWVGGSGAKPNIGQYLGLAGWVSNIAQAVDIRGPAGTGGSGTGLPDNTYIATNFEEFHSAVYDEITGARNGIYIIIPYNIVLPDDFSLQGTNVVIDGMGTGSITCTTGSIGAMSGNTTLKNITMKAYGFGFGGKNIVLDNCKLFTLVAPQILANAGSFFLRNCVFNKSFKFHQTQTTYAMVHGCICGESIIYPPDEATYSEYGNLESVDISNWINIT